MSIYFIHKVVNKFFDTYHNDKTILSIDIQPLEEQYKEEFPKQKYQIEVLFAYSIDDILKRYGYSLEEIEKNKHNDAWLQSVERKECLMEQSLVNPTDYYLFIGDQEVYKQEPNWTKFYHKLLEEYKQQKEENKEV